MLPEMSFKKDRVGGKKRRICMLPLMNLGKDRDVRGKEVYATCHGRKDRAGRKYHGWRKEGMRYNVTCHGPREGQG